MNRKPVLLLLRAEWDRLLGWALVLAAAIALVVGYVQVADSPFVAEQLSYAVSGSLGGLLMAVVGVGLLVSADLHDEWRKLDRIEAVLRGEPNDAGTGGPVQVDLAGSTRRSSEAEPLVALTPRPAPAAMAVATHRKPAPTPFLMVAAGTVVAGALVLAWNHTASTTQLGDAVEGAGLGGAAVVVGALMMLAHGVNLRARLGERKSRLLGGWHLVALVADRQGRRTEGGLPRQDPADVVYAIEGLSRFHRRDCPALSGAEG